MKIVLIDDEHAIREGVKTILNHYFTDLEIREASGVAEGLSLLSSFLPDLLLLDVEMGDGTGFDLLNQLPAVAYPVVFVTAHDDYAVRAFKFSAMDYLLKPVDPEELKDTVEKAQQYKSPHQDQLNAFLHNWKEKQLERIVLSDHANINIVELQEIIRCQSVNNYTHFYLTEGREIVITKTLKHYDELLSDQGFFRVHQSHIINLQYLSKYTKRDGGEVVMKDSSTIPVSSRKKEGLLDLLKNLKG